MTEQTDNKNVIINSKSTHKKIYFDWSPSIILEKYSLPVLICIVMVFFIVYFS